MLPVMSCIAHACMHSYSDLATYSARKTDHASILANLGAHKRNHRLGYFL